MLAELTLSGGLSRSIIKSTDLTIFVVIYSNLSPVFHFIFNYFKSYKNVIFPQLFLPLFLNLSIPKMISDQAPLHCSQWKYRKDFKTIWACAWFHAACSLSTTCHRTLVKNVFISIIVCWFFEIVEHKQALILIKRCLEQFHQKNNLDGWNLDFF